MEAYRPGDARQGDQREQILAFLRAAPDATDRNRPGGHLTASALVLDPALERVLLTLHRKLGRWLQFGGHFEDGDESASAAALREAREESGIVDLCLRPGLIDVDIHELPCPAGRPNRHLDLRFAGVSPPGATAKVSAESIDVRWFPLAGLPAGTDSSVRRALDGACRSLRGRRAGDRP